jgi:hypothetical protein
MKFKTIRGFARAVTATNDKRQSGMTGETPVAPGQSLCSVLRGELYARRAWFAASRFFTCISMPQRAS